MHMYSLSVYGNYYCEIAKKKFVKFVEKSANLKLVHRNDLRNLRSVQNEVEKLMEMRIGVSENDR